MQVDEIPWPPPVPPGGLLAALVANRTAAEQGGAARALSRAAAFKAEYRRSALRWHPDAFARRFRPRLVASSAAAPAAGEPAACGGRTGATTGPPGDDQGRAEDRKLLSAAEWERVLARVGEVAQALNAEWKDFVAREGRDCGAIPPR